MENAVDALKMEGSVLLFVIGLSVSIAAFSQVRQVADIIISYKDRETVYIDGNLYYDTNTSERSVGLETILPTLQRVYSENYRVVFEGLEGPIYTKITGGEEDRYMLDMDNETDILNGGSDGIKAFYAGVIYGQDTGPGSLFESLYIKNRKIRLPSTSLYSKLKKALEEGKTIKEYSGVYYIDDVQKEADDETEGNETETEEVPDVNKTKKRVITYKII